MAISRVFTQMAPLMMASNTGVFTCPGAGFAAEFGFKPGVNYGRSDLPGPGFAAMFALKSGVKHQRVHLPAALQRRWDQRWRGGRRVWGVHPAMCPGGSLHVCVGQCGTGG